MKGFERFLIERGFILFSFIHFVYSSNFLSMWGVWTALNRTTLMNKVKCVCVSACACDLGRKKNKGRIEKGDLWVGWRAVVSHSSLIFAKVGSASYKLCVRVWTCSIVVKLTKSDFLFPVPKGINWCDTRNYRRAETYLLTVCPSKLGSESEPRPTERNNRYQ